MEIQTNDENVLATTESTISEVQAFIDESKEAIAQAKALLEENGEGGGGSPSGGGVPSGPVTAGPFLPKKLFTPRNIGIAAVSGITLWALSEMVFSNDEK